MKDNNTMIIPIKTCAIADGINMSVHAARNHLNELSEKYIVEVDDGNKQKILDGIVNFSGGVFYEKII